MTPPADPSAVRQPQRQMRWLRDPVAPWVVLALSIFLTAAACYFSSREVDSRARERFAFRVVQVSDAVKARMLDYEQVLRGGVGLFLASPAVTRRQWHEYVSNAEMALHYPGIQNMAVSLPVPAAQRDKHIAAVRAEGFPNYTIRPEQPERPLYHTLVYVEPFSDRNLRAFGFDMYTNPTRRAAMDRAIDQGLPSASGMVKLAQETNQDVQHGFIYCLPVYRAGDAPAAPEQRRAALRALVCGGFRMNDLMRGIFGSGAKDMELEIFDDGVVAPESRMYSSLGAGGAPRAEFVSVVPVEVGGRHWSLRVSANQRFLDSVETSQTLLVAVAGILLNLALFAALRSLSGRARKARRLAEEMTRELFVSESKFSDIVSSASDAIVSRDLEGRITSWNPAAESMFGYAAAEAIGQSGLPREPTAGVAGAASDSAAAVAEQVRQRQGVRLRKDGSPVDVSVTLSPMRSLDGKIYGVSEMITDITERKRTENALREGAQYTQTILDNVGDGIIGIDERGAILSANRGAEIIFGYAADELIGRNVKLLMPEPDRSRHDGYLSRYLSGGAARIIGMGREVSGQRKDGEIFPMDLAVSEIAHGGRRMFIGLVRDITERKQGERMKSEFVSTVSHELRTPLTSISGSLGLLAGGALGSLPENVRGLIDVAHKNSLRLIRLINDLLDMEKISAGKLQFDMEEQGLMLLVDQALAANQGYAEEYGVRFVVVERDEEARVRVDAQRLMQVLSNYLSNAAKFSPAQGTVEIAVRRLGENVRVSVRDRGPGVPQAFRSRIFEKFSQADASDVRFKGGTGLGLAITRELVERMGGSLGFDSIEGEGATFYFDLPLASAGGPEERHKA